MKGDITMKKLVSTVLLVAMLLVCLSASALAASNVHFSGSCHVRTGPGTWYDSIGIVNKGSTLTYKGNSQYVDGSSWYNVSFHGKDGWVSAKYASLTDNGGIATYGAGGYGGSSDGYSSGSFAYGGNVYINGKCNVRSGPSLSHNSRGTAYVGDVLFGTGEISTDSRGIAWYSVLYKGSKGWVSSVYASLTGFTKKSSSKSSSSSSSASGSVVVGTSGDSHVRTGPGLGYDKLGVLHNGNSASFLGQTSTDSRGVVWYKISWNGSSGWVSSRYTSLY